MTQPIQHKQVDFSPRFLRRLKCCLVSELHKLCEYFSETESDMLQAINNGQMLIGLLHSFQGRRCLFLEYNQIQVIVPVHEVH